jgi:putative acetyltransferase
MPYTVKQESPDQPEIYPMIEALDKALDAEYEGFCNYRLDVSQLLVPNVRFFVARDDTGKAVGIGAAKFEAGFAEVKRMYSLPEVRGHGVGEAILVQILAAIRAGGEVVARLETGEKLTAAVGLYRKYGFRQIPAFGEYTKTADTSYCMEARL